MPENVSGSQIYALSNTTSISGESDAISVVRTSPSSDHPTPNSNKNRGSQTERSTGTSNTTVAAEARESAC